MSLSFHLLRLSAESRSRFFVQEIPELRAPVNDTAQETKQYIKNTSSFEQRNIRNRFFLYLSPSEEAFMKENDEKKKILKEPL